jgi:hypothetical protein
MYTNFRKRGVFALAYPPDSTPVSPLECSFNVKFSNFFSSATISLQFSLLVNGCDSKRNFILIYDADNLLAGKTTLRDQVDIGISREQLSNFVPEGQLELRTLSLALKDFCPIRCPSFSPPILPHKNTCSISYNHFVRLTRAKETKIVIDISQFTEEYQDLLNDIIETPGNFTGCPFTNNDNKRQQTTWRAFGDAVFEDPPPSYTHPAQHTTKRPREGEFVQYELNLARLIRIA